MMEEIPVYLFTGFLDAGKTKFIQETLEDVRFNNGESTLLLLCEEGEEEYEPTTFSGKNVFIEVIEDPSELTPINLERLQKKHAVERVIVEYNGMWMLDQLYQNMPEAWIVYQEFMFADAQTFLTYNANMRGLVVDKLKSCEMVVLNRADQRVDKVEIHKIIRPSAVGPTLLMRISMGKCTTMTPPMNCPLIWKHPWLKSHLRTMRSGIRISQRSRTSIKEKP